MKKIYLINLIWVFGFLLGSALQAQPFWNTSGNVITPAQYLGTNNNIDLQFKTNAIERMIILKGSGFVGIGTNYLTPNNLLDVRGGDIDIETSTNGYMIGNNYMLRHKGVVSDLFVGVGAGNNAPFSAINNTFLGFNSGNMGNSASFTENTFAGAESGFQAQGKLNTFLGYRAGWSGGGSGFNTFVGAEAGFLAVSGDENVFVGWKSGYGCISGVHNAFFGNVSGLNNSSGSNNTFIGIGSGFMNTTGSGNTSLGAGAGPGSSNLSNTTAISSGAQVMQDDQVILGNNTQKVGIGLSGITPGPQNMLEINTSAVSPVPGASGLRLRDLTSISNTILNPGKGVLSVDINGDVIYVQPLFAPSGLVNAHNGTALSTLSAGFVAFGQDVGQPGDPAQLLNDREIPTNNFNIRFTDPLVKTPAQNLVSFGNIYTGNPLAAPKVYCENVSEPVGIKGITDAGVTAGFLPGVGNIGVMGEVYNSNWQFATGVYGLSSPNPSLNGNWSYGVFGETKLNPNDMAMAIGVAGNSDSPGNSLINCGGWFTASNATGVNATGLTGMNIGVYGWVPSSQFGYAVYSDGNLWVNGNGYATGIFTWSDRRLKKDIAEITNAMDLINKLNPVTYYFNKDNKYNMRLSEKRQYGLIAQEVEEVLPELVDEVVKPAEFGKDGKEISATATLKAINYTELIPLLIQGMQEQQKTISDIKQKISDLSAIYEKSGLKTKDGRFGSLSKETIVDLNDKNNVVLNQNVPNPFAEQTLITFSIPEEAYGVQIRFYNSNSQMIKTVEIETRGAGQLRVYGDDLSSGIYSYSLVIDGRVVDTKKMVKTK
jgi:hypothetical protein